MILVYCRVFFGTGREQRGFFMHMRDGIMVLAAVFASFAANAADPATYTLKKSVSGTTFDWREGSNYEENAKPSPGAHVIIPKDVNAKLTHGQDCWEFVSSLGRIRPATATSYFTVTVPEGTTNSLSCEISYTAANSSPSYDKGGLVKLGGGGLELTLNKEGYVTAVTANEGCLRLNLTATKCILDTLTVEEGAIVDILSGNNLNVRKFFGAGEITSSVGGSIQTLSSDHSVSEFSGKLTGNIRLMLSSVIMLRGDESTTTGNVYAFGEANGLKEKGAVVGVTKFGSSDDLASSLGKGSSTLNFGQTTAASGGFLYLGEGEETDRNLTIRTYNSGSYPFIDGGANGGLTLTGDFGFHSSCKINHRFGLAGSNTADCVFGVKMSDAVTNGNSVSTHIVKRGTGAWKLAPKSGSTWSGGITVEEGTIKFDTLKEAGTFCALGYATNLFECYTGAFDANRRVDWAIALGTSEGKEGSLEYTGTDGVVCSTRPIALQGDGRICQNAEVPFRFSGIKSDGENAKTLTLDGTGVGGNEISGISDAGKGAISVAKDGSGTWTISAANSFSGTLSVKGGTLNVCAPNWNYFKFVTRQNYTNDIAGANAAQSGPGFYVREMAFFNAEGVSQTVGNTYADSLQSVVPGSFILENKIAVDVQHTTTYPDANWNSLFADDSDPAKIGFTVANNKLTPVVDNESSWASIIIRLPEAADPITSFDYVWVLENSKNGCNTQPSYITVMGSLDGFEWTEILTKDYLSASASGRWVSDNKSYSAGDLVAARTNSKKARHGFSIEQPDESIASPLASVSKVSVAAGATLKSLYGKITLDSFGVDMTSGGGTVEGFAFAEAGTLHLDNVVSGGTPLEKTFTPVNCTGVANLSNWTLLVNGAATSKYTASVSEDGKVRLASVAMRVIIR